MAIARCLAMDPEIILFDEPTSALDPTMVSEVLAVIRRLAKEGMTMAIVTHEMDFARDVSNRVFYMDEGAIYEAGTPAADLRPSRRREKTRAFINRIRSFNRRIASVGFDIYALNAEIEQFCEKQILPHSTRQNLLLLVDELLQIHKPRLGRSPVELTIAYSEKSGSLELVIESDGAAGDPLATAEGDDGLAITLIRGFSETIEYRPVDGRSRLEVVVRKD